MIWITYRDYHDQQIKGTNIADDDHIASNVTFERVSLLIVSNWQGWLGPMQLPFTAEYRHDNTKRT